MFRYRCIGWKDECWEGKEGWMNEWIKEWMFRWRCIGWLPGCWRKDEWINESMNQSMNV